MKVSIWREPWNNYIGIMFWEEREGKIYAAEPVQLVFKEAPEGHTAGGPTLRINSLTLQSLAEALDEQNIKTDKDAKIQGTLEASRYHLEDLRKLLKLDKETGK